MIITTASSKGGVAKTTTAIHLAAYLQEKHGDTLLVDADNNRSATHWAERGEEGALPFKVIGFNALAKYAPKYKNIILDTEAGTEKEELKELAEGCDLIVIPTTPDSLAIAATIQTTNLLNEMGCKDYRVLITKIPPPPRTDGADAREYFQDIGLPLFRQGIRELVVFEKAANQGIPVNKVKDKKAGIAWREYSQVAQEVLDVLAQKKANGK